MITKEVLNGINNICDIRFRSLDEKIHKGKYNELSKLEIYKIIKGDLKALEIKEHSWVVWLWNSLDIRLLWKEFKKGNYEENLTKAMSIIADKYREHYKYWLDWAEEQKEIARQKHINKKNI